MNLIDRPLGETADPLFPRQAPVTNAHRKRPLAQLRKHFQDDDDGDNSDEERTTRRKTSAHASARKSQPAPTPGINKKAEKVTDLAGSNSSGSPKPEGEPAKN